MLKRMENKNTAIPGAIIIAGLIIAGAVYLQKAPAPSQVAKVDNAAAGQPADLLKNIRPIDTTDHLRGNPNAPVKIIEYSDLECPFCKVFHQTMAEVMKEYGPSTGSGQVAWVFRHFPLDSLHPKAPHEAVAAECAASLGGEETFWKYVDQIFAITPSNNGLDPALLTKTATDLGLDKAAFQKCLDANNMERITADANNAIASGGQGTPFSLIVGPDGSIKELGGAIPLAQLKAQIEARLAK